MKKLLLLAAPLLFAMGCEKSDTTAGVERPTEILSLPENVTLYKGQEVSYLSLQNSFEEYSATISVVDISSSYIADGVAFSLDGEVLPLATPTAVDSVFRFSVTPKVAGEYCFEVTASRKYLDGENIVDVRQLFLSVKEGGEVIVTNNIAVEVGSLQRVPFTLNIASELSDSSFVASYAFVQNGGTMNRVGAEQEGESEPMMTRSYSGDMTLYPGDNELELIITNKGEVEVEISINTSAGVVKHTVYATAWSPTNTLDIVFEVRDYNSSNMTGSGKGLRLSIDSPIVGEQDIRIKNELLAWDNPGYSGEYEGEPITDEMYFESIIKYNWNYFKYSCSTLIDDTNNSDYGIYSCELNEIYTNYGTRWYVENGRNFCISFSSLTNSNLTYKGVYHFRLTFYDSYNNEYPFDWTYTYN